MAWLNLTDGQPDAFTLIKPSFLLQAWGDEVIAGNSSLNLYILSGG